MKRRTLNTSDSPKIVIEVKRDLIVTGWEQSAVTVETDVAAELMMEQNGNVITIVGDKIHVQVPFAATCIVESCGKQAILRQLTGPISLGSVGGSLILESVGGPNAPVNVESVGGELSADQVGGSLTVQLVGGHAVVTDVAGPCVLDQIGGHLELSRVGAGFRAEVGGNASLDFTPLPGKSYSVEAGGSILCALPDEANAELSMESPAFAGKDGASGRGVVLGAGGSTIRLEAGGAIRLNQPTMRPAHATADEVRTHGDPADPALDDGDGEGFDFDFDLEEFGVLAESFATDLTAKITAKLGLLSDRLPGMLSSAGLSGQEIDDISRQVQEATHRAADKAQAQAQRAADKAIRKADRKLAKARRRMERESFRSGVAYRPTPPSAPRPPVAPSSPTPQAAPPPSSVSQEERMLILRMLEERKISVAQAEELLAAMDGVMA